MYPARRRLNLVRLTIFLATFSPCLSDDNHTDDDYLLCRQCGHEVTKADDLLRVTSSMALSQRNATILGKPGILIQKFENPQGNQFELIMAKDVNVYKRTESFAEYSWFPGYTWRVCLCPRCGFHLGWYFEPISRVASEVVKSFYGLILDHLLNGGYADSLLVIPKAYRS